MAQMLTLTDDELALLRFTGDLFFVDESPLVHVDRSAREPADYAGTYKGLVDRGVIDPHGFRITDTSLNQLAPVTECDARIVHLIIDDDGFEFGDVESDGNLRTTRGRHAGPTSLWP